MKSALTILGMCLIAASLYEQFQTLFHPSGHGTITDWIAERIWRVFRRIVERRPSQLSLAGPLALIAIILTWSGLIVLGCSLIYYTRLTSFAVPQEVASAWRPSFFTAFNISLASLVTVAPDVRPMIPWVRLTMILEGAEGLGLVTASVSWLLSIYPVLEGRSSTAEQAMSLFEAERETGIDVFEMRESELASILLALASELSTLRNQTVQFPITYFFGVRKRRASLEIILPYIDGLAERACELRRSPTLRIAGHALQKSVEAYLRLLGHRYFRMPGEVKEDLLRAYAMDNLRE